MTALLNLGERSGWELAQQHDGDESTPQAARQHARLHLNAGSQGLYWGLYEQARQHLDLAVDCAERHGYQGLHDMAAATRDHLDWRTGAWEGLDRRLSRWAAVGEPMIRIDAQLVGAMLRAARSGPDAESVRALRTLLADSRQRGAAETVAEAAGALARLTADPAQVLAVTGEPVRRMTRKGLWLWAADLLPPHLGALLGTGRRAEAEALAEAFAQGAAGRSVPVLAAALACCRALLAEPPDLSGAPERAAASAAHWRAAADAWQALPRPYDAAQARERAARWLLAAGQPGAAVRELHTAADEFGALGARHDAARVARTLAASGAASGERSAQRRTGRRGYGGLLSPREQEVVRLVVRGLTNRQIAQALSRSPKTIAAQVNSAMRKYGVRTRTALAVRATGKAAAAGPPGADPA
jgi:DNA-binding CsgD family transcriptional regulator